MLDLEYLETVDLHTIPEYELDKIYDEVRAYSKEHKYPLIEPFIATGLYENDDRPVHELIADTGRWDHENGLKLLDYNKRRSRSRVRNWFNQYTSMMHCINTTGASYADGNLNYKDTAGTIHSTTGALRPTPGSGVSLEGQLATSNGYSNAQNSNTFGIVVGTGSDGESMDDFQLSAIIASGTLAGGLYHSWQLLPSKSYSGGVYTVIQKRYFDNFSADQADVVVVEVGAIARLNQPGHISNRVNVLMVRDVLSASKTVQYWQQLSVEYVFTVTFP